MVAKAPALNEANVQFGAFLTMFRKRLGLTQQQVAVMGGIHTSDYSKMERGEKNPPKIQTVQVWITGMKLSRREARELLRAARYPLSALDQITFDPSLYPVTIGNTEEGLRDLHGSAPAWYIDTDGTIISANLTACRLWEGAQSQDEIQEQNRILGSNILGVNVYEVLVRPENMRRILMPSGQGESWYNIIVVYKKLKAMLREETCTIFEGTIAQKDVLRLILEHGNVDIPNEWEYTLSILPPRDEIPIEAPKQFLEFLVRVERVMRNEKLDGFLVISHPLIPYASKWVEKEYAQLIAAYGHEGFVQHSDTHLLEEAAKPPAFFPAVHWEPFSWNINLTNTEFDLLYDVQGNSLRGTSFFELLFSPRMANLTNNTLTLDKLSVVVREFLQSTQDVERDTKFRENIDRFMQIEEFKHIINNPKLLVSEQEDLPEVDEDKPWFRVEMTNPFTNHLSLSFLIIVRKPTHLENDYRMTFVPANAATRAALILIRLRPRETVYSKRFIGRAYDEQMLWFLAILRTIREGYTKKKGNEDDFRWNPVTDGYERIRTMLAATFPASTTSIENEIQLELARVLVGDATWQEGILSMLIAFTKPAEHVASFLRDYMHYYIEPME